jgi:transcriptional regulator with XRE-family HTH domain
LQNGTINEGSRGLSKSGQTCAAVAEKLGCSVGAVESWRTGRRKPALGYRDELADWLNIPATAWDRDVPKLSVVPNVAPVGGSATASTVVSQADYLLAELRLVQAALQAATDEAPSVRLGYLNECAKITATLGKLTGVGLTISMRRILQSPDWLALQTELTSALRPFPEASRAVAAALTRCGL